VFKGYKLKFEFNAAHSNLENNVTNTHFHTFTIVLYLNDMNEEMDYFFDIEKNINEWLAPYRDCYLHETELFAGKSTTLESIGETFYELWREKLTQLQFDLVRLDIFENPIRMYSVSDRMLDADVNELGTLPHAFYGAVEFERPKQVQKETVAAEEPSAGVAAASTDANAGDTQRSVLRIDGTWNKKTVFFALFACGWIVAVATLIMYVICGWGNYPSGADTYCHLYRADVILENIREGNWFPLYDPYWYNGVEIMRYWGPVPLYVLAFAQYIGGDIFAGYIGYIGLLFVIGALGWLMFGRRLSRMWLGVFVGCVWFFIPENMKVTFYDGNMPRALINALLPWLVCFVYDLIEEKKARNICKLTLLFSIITLCHIGTTLMLVVVLLIYLLVYGKVHKNFKTIGHVLLCVGNGMLLSGIWMIPSFHGSGAGGSNNQVMEGFFQDALLSLNPFPAWNGETLFYFGLSVFVLCVLGLFLGNKETLPGFSVGLIIFFLTSKSSYDILSKLPFSSYLWMVRFVSMALAFVMAAFMLWKGLKRHFVVFLCILMLIDCLPGLRYIYSGTENVMTADEKNDIYGAQILMKQAKDITSQRMTVFDLSGYEAFAPYYVSGTGRKVLYMFGAGWEGARTAENIVMLNTAIETGNYNYVFDRCIEMGTDTILFVTQKLENKERDIGMLTECGARFGYETVLQNDRNLLMHKEAPESFGVVSKYPYLAIGAAAKDIALLYPAFEEGKSENLSDYTYEELKEYKCIYLSDFSYKDKAEAESMLSLLADGGTKIFIDMNKVPVARETNVQEMFGVSVQSITYNNSFPVITYNGKEYKTAGFPDIYREWKANYLIGLKEVTGKSDINGRMLAFSGTNGNDNIVFLGYNFIYYTELTGDLAARELLSEVFGVTEDEIPDRTIVPLGIEFKNREIVIESPEDCVGTTLADIKDIFSADREYHSKNHMITVDKGMTVVSMHYPYFIQGSIVSVIGVIMLLTVMIVFHKNRRSDVL